MKIYGILFFCCMHLFLDCSLKRDLSWEHIDAEKFYPDDATITFFKKTLDKINLIEKNQENLRSIASCALRHKDKKSIQVFVEKFRNKKNSFKEMSIKTFSNQVEFEKKRIEFFEINSTNERLGESFLAVEDWCNTLINEHDRTHRDMGIANECFKSLFGLYQEGKKADDLEVSSTLHIFLKKSRNTIFADLEYGATLQPKEQYLNFLGQSFKL
ncbi:MAG: hypothetical protein ACXWL5_03435 [Candidatus Chromulinivorax sp.]